MYSKTSLYPSADDALLYTHTCCKHLHLDRRISASTAAALHSAGDLARKVLSNVRDVADRVAVG
jgi:hypothetical protein